MNESLVCTLDFVECKEFAEYLEGILFVFLSGDDGDLFVFALGSPGFLQFPRRIVERFRGGQTIGSARQTVERTARLHRRRRVGFALFFL